MPDRDMSEPQPTTPAEARKRSKELHEHPEKLREHYRDELTEADPVPPKDPDEEGEE
jgi:hypothetical protein